MVDKPRYLYKRNLKRKSHRWEYDPPQELIEEGIAERKNFWDYRLAKKHAIENNRRIDNFRNGVYGAKELKPNHTLRIGVGTYFQTETYKSVSSDTQKYYRYCFKRVCDFKLTKNQPLGDRRLELFDHKVLRRLYYHLARDNVTTANWIIKHVVTLFSFFVEQGIFETNPAAGIKRRKREHHRHLWTKDQLEQFISTSFTDEKWRNLGLLALMMYSWDKRFNAIRTLRWDQVDLDNKTVTVDSETIDIDPTLHDLLTQQKKDLGFQEYVLPIVTKGFRVDIMSCGTYLDRKKEVLEAAGLPPDLQFGGARRLAEDELKQSDERVLFNEET